MYVCASAFKPMMGMGHSVEPASIYDSVVYQ